MECQCKKKARGQQEKKALINRLSRIEGQVRGIVKMVENDCYCADILNQVMAAQAAMRSFGKLLLAEHIKTCVVNDIKTGQDEQVHQAVDELIGLIEKADK